MALYDLKYMLKRLLPAYIMLLLIFSVLGLVVYVRALQTAGVLITALVSFRLFWKEYMGEHRIMINMLPIGTSSKIIRKLFCNILFTAVFFLIVLEIICFLQNGLWGFFVALYNLDFVLHSIIGVIFVSLGGFAAISMTKGRQGFAYILRNFVIIFLISGLLINLLMRLPFISLAEYYAAYAVIIFVLFFISKYNMDRQ